MDSVSVWTEVEVVVDMMLVVMRDVIVLVVLLQVGELRSAVVVMVGRVRVAVCVMVWLWGYGVEAAVVYFDGQPLVWRGLGTYGVEYRNRDE